MKISAAPISTGDDHVPGIGRSNRTVSTVRPAIVPVM
jgi:hypothetical protein